MVRAEAVRRYEAPCRSCGDRDVVIVVTWALEPGMELVLGNCQSCETVRCRYKRRIRAPKATP
jgi:hypothetical protein